jgi:DNA processing protein
MDHERGLLGLIIARLGGRLGKFSYREKLLLCESFNTERELLRQSAEDIEALIGRRLTSHWDLDTMYWLAERDAERARLKGINWVSWYSSAYPPLLREIYDPPIVLFFKGNLPNPEAPLAAIVGTRKPSPQSAAQSYRIAHDLARSGVSVISGLALGIDGMAHRGNIEGGAPTVAVLGSGLDNVYPSSNRPLARRILETGGCLLSEYPPGTGPRKWNFPARNRIISGLARGVLIVEAPEKSGALITARFALEHNREVWVAACGLAEDDGQKAAGGKTAFDRKGSTRLAADGAGIIRDASDILEAWDMETTGLEMPEIASGVSASSGLALAASLAHSLDVPLE